MLKCFYYSINMVTFMEFNLQKMVFEFQQSWASGFLAGTAIDGNQPWLRNPIIELNGQCSIAMQYNHIGNIMEILQWEL